MKLVFVNHQNKFRIPKKFLEKKFSNFIKLLKKNKNKNAFLGIKKQIDLLSSNRDLTFVFLSSNEIKKLNASFRGINKPTDVLSFKSDDSDIYGELIFCPQIISMQAKENQWSQQNEYLYMMIHGFLHLLGLDHENKKEAQSMFKLQDLIFNLLMPASPIDIEA